MDKGSPELLTTEAMSAPIPEKDKTPLMLLEDRVAALEGNAQANEAVLLNWVKRSIAMEERVRRLEDLHLVAKAQEEQAHLVAEFERCKADPHYFISNYCKVKFTTSDPQGPYRLDTKPHDANSVRVSVTEWTEDFSGSQDSNVPQYIIEGMEWMREQLVLARNLGLPYVIAIDPKASPKNIPFSVALEYMRAGREVRRPHWATPSRRRVQPHGIGGVGGLYVITGASYNEGPFSPDTAEMVATDWEVIPEP